MAILTNGDLVVGGDFQLAGGFVSAGFAQYSFGQSAPGVAAQPDDVATCPNATVSFVIEAVGHEPLEYQWRKDSIAIDTIDNPSAATRTLSIANVRPQDAASYDCVVVNACGHVTSEIATLVVCAADFNCDGFLDFFDYGDFVECFETEVCGGGGGTADFNGDGFVDFFDYADFVEAFEAGC